MGLDTKRTIFEDKRNDGPPPAGWFNSIPSRIWDSLNVGPGLRKNSIGGKCVLTLTATTRGGGGGMDITPVLELPEIPTEGGQMVFWQSSTTATGGTGDDQVWMAYAGQTKWTPIQHYTIKSGIPA